MSSRILLVDDDLNILDTAKDILEDAGYVVAVAASMSTALTCLENTSFDAIITDLNLPDGNGLDLARQARVHSLRLHVLLMTGEAEGSNPAGLTARQNGEVDDYLVKPVNPSQLLTLLHRILA